MKPQWAQLTLVAAGDGDVLSPALVAAARAGQVHALQELLTW
jgi:hypothetical protein